MTPATADRWRCIHRFCNDETAFASLDEARYVLAQHAGHGPGCLQFLGALSRASEVAA